MLLFTQPFEEIIGIRKSKTQRKYYFWNFKMRENILDFIDPNKSIARFKKGANIYEKGNPANTLFYVVSGNVKTEAINNRGRTITTSIYSEKEFFGEQILFGNLLRINSAFALTEVSLYAFTKNNVQRLITQHPTLQYYFMDNLASKVRNHEQRLLSLAFQDSRNRVIEFLIYLAQKEGQRVGYEILIKVFFTHQEIANYTATSRQTVNKTLLELTAKNIIFYNRKRLLVRDLQLLIGQL